VSRPLVSIVVPAYNREGFVETTITSLLEQDYEALEVIALDDGSDDETSAVLERIAQRAPDHRFRWGRHDNIGQAATINRGFEQARGDLLGYVSSDDYLLPGAISRLAAAAEEHPDADVIYPDFFLVDESDHVTDRIRAMQHTLVDALRFSLCYPGVGALVRRRCYERIGGWDPRYRYAPDFEWWLRAGDARFVAVPEPLGAWRVHGGSITMNDFGVADVRARLSERFVMLDEIFARDDLPPEVRAAEKEAWGTMLIEMGVLIDQEGLSRTDRRFAIEDRLMPERSELAEKAHDEARLWDIRLRELAEQRVALTTHENAQLKATVDVLRLRTREQDDLIAQLRRDRPAGRPLWLKAARRLVPMSLRPRVGAAFHRLRHRRAA
jgi:hypothetical protein